MALALNFGWVFSPFRWLVGRKNAPSQTVFPPEVQLPAVTGEADAAPVPMPVPASTKAVQAAETGAAARQPEMGDHSFQVPQQEFALVQRMTKLMSLDQIERFLPDILGRALARGWIDRPFQAAFMENPKLMLSSYDVYLPDSVAIEVETEPGKRPRIVVYEAGLGGEKRRLLYLQLVMMAGR